ncbi:50S ribosomal protein L17 [Candidatus Malacoplasma girerdii]|uniref:50S ribosomal protein L17 n=1 Tax=Candidatus Malacoplasma girerdii TaxID=1318617 RepID=A0A097SSA6_9BACT|nr:50S ribosomal protein L17 [Candidatus Malacoplasma girerdii]ASJ89007.1 MAG: 50S ribosomal protein L17 [Candidatus Malacoplasma girerdii]
MSFINKKGKTTAWRKMVIRQQVTDVIAYGKIITTITKAKETQKHVDKLITLAKNPTLFNIRRMHAIVLDNSKLTKDEVVKKAIEIAKKYKDRKGGYTSVLRVDERLGDNTSTALLRLV